MTQVELFPPHNNTDTSFAAAESVAESAAAKRAVVFGIIERQPSTCDAVELLTDWAHQTVSARIWELHEKQKRVIDSGQRQLTRRSRWAIVWRAVDEAHPWVPVKRPTRPPLNLLKTWSAAMHTVLSLLGEDVLGEGFVAGLRWIDEILEIAPLPKVKRRKKDAQIVSTTPVEIDSVEAIL